MYDNLGNKLHQMLVIIKGYVEMKENIIVMNIFWTMCVKKEETTLIISRAKLDKAQGLILAINMFQ